MDEETISLQDFMDALLKRWWVMLLGAGLAALIAVAIDIMRPASFDPPPLHQPEAATVVFLEGAETLAQFPELVESKAVLESTIADLGLALAVSELRERVTASPVGNTSLLRITAQGLDEASAIALADGVARSLVDHIWAAQQARPALLQAQLAGAPGDQASRESLAAAASLRPYIIAPAEALEAAPSEDRPSGTDNTLVRNLILGLLLGGVMAGGAVVALEYIQSPLRSPAQLERRFKLAPLVILPRWDRPGGPSGRLAINDASGPAAEALGEAAAGMAYAAGVRHARVLAVVSPESGDGRTSLIANLGVALAGGWRRVILVDGDLRRPGLYYYFGLNNRNGLRDFLSNASLSVSDVIQATAHPRLKVITAGLPWPDAGRLLDSPRMNVLWEHLREEADLVLVDTPPAGATVAASVIASQVQGVVLLVNGESVRQDSLEATLARLGTTGIPVLGYVWNRMSPRRYAGSFGSRGRLSGTPPDSLVRVAPDAEIVGNRDTVQSARPEPALNVGGGL
jgi:polysaccharide biosynthesis transport protein